MKRPGLTSISNNVTLNATLALTGTRQIFCVVARDFISFTTVPICINVFVNVGAFIGSSGLWLDRVH
jgi:hypothetical protein